MKIVGVIQARMGSTRLPGKVLADVGGIPLLQRMVQRARWAKTLDAVVVATTTASADDPIRELCRDIGVPCTNGHASDLLDRHLQAAYETDADAIVKIPSDCPLIDPRIVDRVVRIFRGDPGRWDYLGNLHPASYPDGNDVEVVPVSILAAAACEATLPHEREHTTPFIWDQPDRFRIGNVGWELGIDLSMTYRLTVDYPEDLELVRQIFAALDRPGAAPFPLQEILAFLYDHPEIAALNQHLAGVNWYRHHLNVLRTVRREETVLFEDA